MKLTHFKKINIFKHYFCPIKSYFMVSKNKIMIIFLFFYGYLIKRVIKNSILKI